MKIVGCLLITLCLNANPIFCQVKPGAYFILMEAFQKDYRATHEIVKVKDTQYFRFFPIDSVYRIKCTFEKVTDGVGFSMKESGNAVHHYFKYGKLTFSIRDTILHLFVYRSKDLMKTKEYKDYLFIPFTDLTTGDESYGSGRYMDVTILQVIKNTLEIDFNKAYNPYCAYAIGYHCPIPPKENYLPVEIRAGEKTFAKGHE